VTARVLHLEVGRPSAEYGKKLGDVTNYARDATGHVQEIARQLDARLVSLSGRDATRDAAVRAISDARDELRGDAPALFVLSFVGHGGKIADDDGDELIDHEDEGWGLDDAPLIDDEIKALVREFSDNVHIVVLSNCCYADGIDIVETRGPMESRIAARLAARRASWLDAVTRLGKDRLRVPLAADAPHSRGAPVERPPRKWVLAAVCHLDESFMAPSQSAFSSTILETVFPLSDGGRRRDPDATYHALGRALAAAPGLPVFATATVSGPEAVLQGRAFVAT
jgi:hypothetical protein